MNAFAKAWALLKDDEGTMRRVIFDDKGNAEKIALPHRATKLGQLPINMGISQALQEMNYPIEGEKPFGYRGEEGYTVTQPKAHQMFREPKPARRNPLQQGYRRRPPSKPEVDLANLEFAFQESPLINLLTSDRGDLDIHPGNLGYFGNELKTLDPMYGPERKERPGDVRENAFNHAIRDMYETMHSDFDAGENTALDPNLIEAWKERLRQVREASDELPEFIQRYKNREMFRPWLDDESENIDPRHRQQMLERFNQYKNFGDALAWLQNTINDPEQSRLYDFEDNPKYKQYVDFMQQAGQSERGPESFYPAQQIGMKPAWSPEKIKEKQVDW